MASAKTRAAFTMPIFSNRSIARMLDHISTAIGTRRAFDLARRLEKFDEGAIAAEWEIALIYCLAQQGKIRVPTQRENVGDLDVVYASPNFRGRVAIEITAISDDSLHHKNPVRAFTDELGRIAIKRGVHQTGGIFAQIGEQKGGDEIVLGVPLKRDFVAFFGSAEIREFFEEIRANPELTHEYVFTARGAASRLLYQPGRPTSGSGHRLHTVITDPLRNPIVTRLKAKDRQIRKAGIDLPSVVIMCDAGCHAMRSQANSPGTAKVDDVVDLFLSGRPHVEMGPWTIQRGERSSTRRINAVVLWPLHEEWHTHKRGVDGRKVKPRVIPNRGKTYHAVYKDLVIEIAGAARFLPPIVNMPINALRVRKVPPFYGNTRSTFSRDAELKIKLSLLAVQKTLSGAIPYEKFVEDHADAFQAIKNVTERGAMLSEVRIEREPDRDDDWIEFTFGAAMPDRLFEDKPIRKQGLLSRLRSLFGKRK